MQGQAQRSFCPELSEAGSYYQLLHMLRVQLNMCSQQTPPPRQMFCFGAFYSRPEILLFPRLL